MSTATEPLVQQTTQSPLVTKGAPVTIVLQPQDVVPGVIVAQGVDGVKPPEFYPSQLCCWDNCKCGEDLPLCCYSFWCPCCAYADIMSNLKAPSCCCPVGFSYSFGCVTAAAFATWAIQHIMVAAGLNTCGAFVNVTPCVTCTSREALATKYSLPTDECCCSCCAHYCCQTCALYQESVYVKHVLKMEPQCCCYECCCQQCCGATPVGAFPGVPGSGVIVAGAPPAAESDVVTSQPEDA